MMTKPTMSELMEKIDNRYVIEEDKKYDCK